MNGPQLLLRQLRREAEGVVSYEFVPASDAPLPAFTAGAHIDLQMPGGLQRSYSLVNDPGERHRYVIAVDRSPDSRGGSDWMHSTPRPGDHLASSVPVNDFPLYESAPHSIFIAGGIGITPFMSMVARLNTLGRSWHLHYATRLRRRAAYLEELNELDRSGNAVSLHCTGEDMQRPDIAAIVRGAPAESHLYCCGPSGMLDAFASACSGLPPQRVHLERFTS